MRAEDRPFWKDHKGAGVNAVRTRTLIGKADVVVVRFGDKYKQWNAAFDAGYAAALGKTLITLHDSGLTHALKEVDRAALAVAETPEQVEAPVHYTPEERAHDPREQQAWFLRLPEHAKQDLREKWKIQEGASEEQIARRKATMWRYVIESVAIFVVPVFLFVGLSWLTLLVYTLVGGAVGFAAWRIRAGTFQYPFLGFAGWFVIWGLSGLGIGFLALFWFIGWTGALGAVHHLQKFDGSET